LAIVAALVACWMTASLSAAEEPRTASAAPVGAKINPEHPLAPALDQAYKAREALDEIDDYEAHFEKKELLGRQLVHTKMTIKLREDPLSVYLLFHEPNQGREVIYVEGKNNGMLLAHEAGIKSLAGTLPLPINSERAMDGNKYPITKIGIRTLLDQVIAQWEEEGKYGETEVKYYPNNPKFGDIDFKAIESKHPQPRKQFRFHITRLYIEKETNIPFRVEQFGFPQKNDKSPPLVEEYTYTKLKTNAGLQDLDFDVKNPKYAFP
jgi:hypothetical protein